MSVSEPTRAGEPEQAVAPTRSYLVCATPRSGSTLLCETLLATGVAGRPREYFEALKETGQPRRPREYFWGLRSPEVIRLLPHDANIELLAARSETWSREDYRRHLDWALREGTTPNAVFGAKMMWGYFNDFLELARGIPRFGGMGDGSLLNAAFPGLHYVFISRSDKVRQAVSLWRALQTWVWRKEAGAPADEPAEPALRLLLRRDRPPARPAAPPRGQLARLLLPHRTAAALDPLRGRGGRPRGLRRARARRDRRRAARRLGALWPQSQPPVRRAVGELGAELPRRRVVAALGIA
jgi:LPS sulfotransferase NodH